MNIESHIGRQGFKKLVLAQSNRPVVFLDDGELDYLSELVLDGDEIKLILKASGLENHLNTFSFESTFYKDGAEYLVKSLCFPDSIRVEILKVESMYVERLGGLNLPGYVMDWAQAPRGFIFFYGSDYDAVDSIKLSFLQERSSHVNGSTLLVRGSDPRLSGVKGHFFTTTQNESFLKKEDFRSLDFNAYMLSKDLHLYDPLQLLRLVEKGALILIHSPWSSLDKFLFTFNIWSSNIWSSNVWSSNVWSSRNFQSSENPQTFQNSQSSENPQTFQNSQSSENPQTFQNSQNLQNFQNDELKKLLLQETLGFVGVKTITDVHGAKRSIFEVMPIEKEAQRSDSLSVKSFDKSGLTFNQFLYSMLLKREIGLKEAYSCSLDPEGLNVLLDELDENGSIHGY